MRGDAVEEPAVVRRHERAAREFEERFFQGAQGFDVEVVRRFVKEQHVAARKQGLRKMQTTALAAREGAHELLLVAPLEVEAADVGAARHLELADLQNVVAFRNGFEHGLVVRERIAHLIDRGDAHGLADLDRARVGRFLARDHLEERRLAGAVRTDHADDGAGRNAEGKIVDQETVAEALRDVFEFDHVVAETVGHGDEDFVRFVAGLVFVARELFKARETGLRLRLTALGILTNPFEFVLNRLHAGVLLTLFDFQALFLLVEPRGIVPLPGDALAAVEFENPLGSVVEEVAVVRHGDDGAREAVQELFEPLHAFGVEVVRRFVEKKHVRAREKQAAERHAALFAPRKVPDLRIPRRQTQRVGGDFHLRFGVRTRGGDDRFEARLFGGERVEVRVGLGVGGVHGVKLRLRLDDFAHALFDGFAHGLFGIELRLLREVADLDPGHRNGFAFDVRVNARHDLEERRLACAVQTENADLGAREEGKGNVLEDLSLRRNHLADAIHREYVLSHKG